MLKCTKIDFGWGAIPDPAGAAYSASALPDSVAGMRFSSSHTGNDSLDYVFSLWARLYKSQYRKGTGPYDI